MRLSFNQLYSKKKKTTQHRYIKKIYIYMYIYIYIYIYIKAGEEEVKEVFVPAFLLCYKISSVEAAGSKSLEESSFL